MVEVIEHRERGADYTWFTAARERAEKPANIQYYEIQGIKHKIQAPKYRHLSRTKKGDLLRIFSPAEGEYRILETKITKSGEDKLANPKFEPLFREGDREFEDAEIRRSHEEWTKKSMADKWLVFIMVLITAMIFVIGTFLTVDGLKKVADSSASMSGNLEKVSENIANTDIRWGKLVDRIDLLLEKHGIGEDVDNTTLLRPPA